VKRFLVAVICMHSIAAFAQTTTVNNLVVTGSSTFSGPASFSTTLSTVTPPFGDNSTTVSTTAFVANHSPCASIMDYGGDNTGANDNTSALVNTINAQPAGKACVFFPAGTYSFSGQVAYALPDANSSITILGESVGSTNLIWPNGGGLQITMPGGVNNSVHIRDLSILNGSTGSGNAAITLLNSTSSAMPVPVSISDITNVSIHGSDGYGQNNYWQQGVYVSSWSNISFVNVTVEGSAHGGDLPGYTGQGIGIALTGNSGSNTAPQGIDYNITACQFNYLNTGVQYNHWVEGVTVSQSNFVGGKIGIDVTTPGPAQDQLSVVASQFNDSDYDILDSVGIAGMTISNNYFLSPTPAAGSNNSAILLSSVYQAVVSGNNIQRLGASSAGTNGITIGTNNYAGAIVTGNVITGMGTGVFLQNTSSGNNVQSNLYHANGSNVVNSGTNNVVGGGSP
jgi:hypothetical protein